MQLYKNLLDQVSAITNRYQKVNELTGENFNVFRILKLESSEVRMHSAFIAELLNPKGTHGQKDVFLKIFKDIFCFKTNEIDTESCRVDIEKHTGFISSDKTEGGRIDIMITDKDNNHILIENKIYAGDQENQLLRYYAHAPEANLIYLTLAEREPALHSKGHLEINKHFKCFTYKSDILKWLELCRKEVAVYPIVREALTHYINLIKHLTSQSTNSNMEEELSDLLKSNLEASFQIAKNLDKACQKVSDEYKQTVENAFEKIGLNCVYDIDFDEQYSGIWISKPGWKYVNIGFQFQSYDKNMIYGFSSVKDPSVDPIPIDLRDNLNALSNNSKRNNIWWAWYRPLELPYGNWNELEAWMAIIDGRMNNMLIEKTQYLLNLSKNISDL